MKRTKIGSLLVISVLALAGIGIAYAGFTDTISVQGDVNTATVTLELKNYSGTYVYKIWTDDDKVAPELPDTWPDDGYEPDNELLVLKGFVGDLPLESQVIDHFQTNDWNAELVAHAIAEPGDGENEVKMTYDNLFPCIDFTADFVFHYDGSIPAKLWAEYEITSDNNDDLLGMLLADDEITLKAYECEPDDDGWNIDYNAPVDIGHQVHNCDHIYVELTIHIPQDNKYQGLSGSFTAWIHALQWNEDGNTHNWD